MLVQAEVMYQDKAGTAVGRELFHKSVKMSLLNHLIKNSNFSSLMLSSQVLILEPSKIFQPSILSVCEEDNSRTVQLRHVTPLQVHTMQPHALVCSDKLTLVGSRWMALAIILNY